MPPLHYLILAHHRPAQLGRLVRRLAAPGVVFHIHVDARCDQGPFEDAVQGIDAVYFPEDRKLCSWGGFGLVEAQHVLARSALRHGREGRAVLLSGQDYPLCTNAAIRAFFERHAGTDFIDIRRIRVPDEGFYRDHYERMLFNRFELGPEKGAYLNLPPVSTRYFWLFREIHHNWRAVFNRPETRAAFFRFEWLPDWRMLFRKRRVPFGMTHYGGQQWWALRLSTLESLLSFTARHPEIDAFFRYCQVPDELYYQTLIMHRAENGQPFEWAPSVTYTDWSRPGVPLPVVFQEDDADQLQTQAAFFLFARKFDALQNPGLLDLLDRNARDTTPALREKTMF